MRELSLPEIQYALASTECEGADVDVDEPEGARYIRISETLALEIAWNLGRLHGEMIKLRERIAERNPKDDDHYLDELGQSQ